MKISHIINPVIMNKNSDLFYAQPMTFESMLNAKKCAEKISNVNIELLAACYEEDESIVPDYIKKTSNLTASLLDLMQPIKPRKLLFIKDILDRAVESDSDYIIYTNVDISLTKEFYTKVLEYIKLGHDALIINRITMPKYNNKGLEWYLENIKTGKKHAGYDCFVFKKSAYSKFILGHIVIGINWIDEILLRNVLTFACNPIVLQSPYMTFHMGDDLIWKDRDYSDQRKFNQLEAYALMDELANHKLSV